MDDGYPDDWDHRRKKVYQRDGYQCQRCGASGGMGGNAELHAHHKTPKSEGGSHNLSNLQTLCSDCHSQVHGHPVGGNATGSQSGQSLVGFTPLYTFAIGWGVSFLLFSTALTELMWRFDLPFSYSSAWVAWFLCSTVIAILTYGGWNFKSAIVYTVYGALLTVVIMTVVPADWWYLLTIVLVLTNVADIAASNLIDWHDNLSTRLAR